MNFFTFTSILNCISGLIVAIFMFTQQKATPRIIIWGYMGLLTAFWGVGTFIVSTSSTISGAYIGWQIGKIASVLGPVVHHHFVLEITKHNKRQLIFLYTFATLTLLVNFFAKEYFLGDLKLVFNQFFYMDWWVRKNPLYLLYYVSFYWILLFYSFGLILKHYKICKPEQRNSLKYIILGSVIIWIGAHGDFPLVFGLNLYPYSNFLFALSPIVIGYGILKHKTLDIEIVLHRGFVYSLTITLISMLFIVIVICTEKIFQGYLGYKTTYASILSAIVIAVLFAPLRNKIHDFTERFFFKASTVQIVEQNALLRQEVIKTEKLKTVATLASGMAHEIKNPLTAIKVFSEYLPNKMDDKEFLQKFSAIVGKEVNRIDELVNELLDFARPSPIQLKATNINDLINDTLTFLNSQLLKNKIKVETALDPGCDTLIRLDPNKIKQALLNIIINAIDAMNGGGTLTITTTCGDGDVRSPLKDYGDGKSITITITDTGCGIKADQLKNIFDPFFSTKDHGTGLGLPITHSIIKEHAGNIKVESGLGKGTTFIINLPMNN